MKMVRLDRSSWTGLVTIVLIGALLVWSAVTQADRRMRSDLLLEATLLAEAVPHEAIASLTGTEADLGSNQYQRLKQALVTVRAVKPRCRFIYLTIRSAAEEIRFLVDSEIPTSADYSPPGQVYGEAPEAFSRAFDTSDAAIAGPFSDRWGTWLTAVVPVKATGSDVPSAVLGMDVDRRDWNRALAASAVLPAAFTLVFAVIVLLSLALLPAQRRQAGMAAVFGIGLTICASWLLWANVMSLRLDMFRQLALDRTRMVSDMLQDIDLKELEGLNQFYTVSSNPSLADFNRFSRYLARDTSVSIWDWIPAVRATDKADFEREARRAGLDNYEIWQKDTDGRRVPATGGPLLYPVYAIAPLKGNEMALGFDLGSEPVRREVIDSAVRTGLSCASESIALVQETENQKSILICKPVFSRTEPPKLRGLTLAVIRMGTLLESARDDGRTLLGISYVHADAPPEVLAAMEESIPSPLDGLSLARPVFAFGKVFLITASAGSVFIKSNPVYLVWLAAIGGLVLTITLAMLVNMTVRRQEELEHLVEARTLELRKSEESYRNQFAKNSVAMLLVDQQDLSILDANEAAVRFYGYTKEELCHRNITDINEMPVDHTREIMACISEIQGVHYEAIHRLANGTSRNVAVSSSSILFRGRPTLHSIITDITEQKRMEASLEALRQRLVLATKAGKVGIWDFDIASNSLVWDEEMYRLYGISSDQFSGAYDAWQSGLHPDDKARGDLEIQQAIDGTKDFDTEFQVLWPNGEIHTIRALAQVQRDEEGNALHMIGTNWDITSQKQAEIDLRESNEFLRREKDHANELMVQANAANHAKSVFLSTMSHEIRTPMNGIIGMTGLLLDTSLTDEQKQFAQIIRSSGEALLTLINDILDFSKIEAGKIELENIDFHLRIAIDDTIDILTVKAAEKGLRLVNQFDAEVYEHLRGDPGRLRQVLLNLVGNAIKFTSTGSITIHTSLADSTPTQEIVRIEVIDTGIGIPSDKLELLFKPFTQVDTSTSRKYGGTGLGLAISKQLCELMGGSIGATSEEGKGSTFFFTAIFEKREAGIVADAETIANLAGLSVLVVDGDETSRMLLASLLTSWGCSLSQTSDGAEALALLEDQANTGSPFSVALLDMQTPSIDGEELGRLIKANPKLRQTHLIMLTSMESHGDVSRFAALGFSGYLARPVRQAQLRACIAEALEGSGAGKGQSASRRIADVVGGAVDSGRAKQRILLAEDNITNQIVAVKILEKLGYRVDVVANGREVLSSMEHLPYDLVLMDCQMPEMDGYEASRQIRAREQPGVRIPIIAMTANALSGDRERCTDAGMDDYLSKPVEPARLAAMLGRWLDRAGVDIEELVALESVDESPVQIAANAISVFDRESFMSRVMGDEGFGRMLVAAFLEDAPTQVQTLETLVTAGEAEPAGRQAHKIKGAAANMSAEAVREVAGAMEQAGKAGNVEFLKALLPELQRRFDILREAMQDF